MMAKTTETDIQKLGNLIEGIDHKIDVLDKKVDNIDTRLIEIEKKIDKQDNRLWAFAGIILAAALAGIIRLIDLPTK
jgi:hypothetical protein